MRPPTTAWLQGTLICGAAVAGVVVAICCVYVYSRLSERTELRAQVKDYVEYLGDCADAEEYLRPLYEPLTDGTTPTATPSQPAALLSIYPNREGFEAARAKTIEGTRRALKNAPNRIALLEKEVDDLIKGSFFQRPSAAAVAGASEELAFQKHTFFFLSCKPERIATRINASFDRQLEILVPLWGGREAGKQP